MATLEELKLQLAQQNQQIESLQPAVQTAQINLNQAQQALTEFSSQPGNIKLSQVLSAQKAAQADPTNTSLQAEYQQIQTKWNAQQAAYIPLLNARDLAATELSQANAPLVAAKTASGDTEVEIAKLDPSQATPEATQYLKENGEYPVTPSSDPIVAKTNTNIDQSQITSPDSATTTAITSQSSSTETISSPESTTTLDTFTPATVEPISDFTPQLSTVAPTTDVNVQTFSAIPSIPGQTIQAQSSATKTIQNADGNSLDWRVRLSLAENATYLYKNPDPGILYPLKCTKGVIFPYTPSISITYAANYDSTSLVHSNYKIFQYTGSGIDQVNITCDFTAQDTSEANYLLATIHFFKTLTKMFYGQDTNPAAGTPPPLCFLTGLGQFQFNNHPLVISNFSYNLPANVDYIPAGNPQQGNPTGALTNPFSSNIDSTSTSGSSGGILNRLLGQILPGGRPPGPKFSSYGLYPPALQQATYVPTHIQLQITCYPIVSRNDISNNFSQAYYADGSLVKKGFW